MGLIDEMLDKAWNFGAGKLAYWFAGPFWGLVEVTALVTIAAIAIAYFFHPLRAFCGAVVMSEVALWYGYHLGQRSLGG